jgi:dCMP deaminase
MISKKWDYRFIRLAREVSTWSKDPSTQIGSVIVDNDRRILGTGYNGFPARIADDSRLNDREQKYDIIIHGEMNALMNCLQSGVPVNKATIYVYGLPCCSNCSKMLVQAGISRVVVCDAKALPDRWIESLKKTDILFEEAGVVYERILKEELD